jgi:DNA-binding FadR family transcriptional regulator
MSSGERDAGAARDPNAQAEPRADEAEPRNLTFGLTDTLGKAIVTGAYDSARFPTEAELAEQHKVSRSVTREAVKMLTAKGLLTARPRRGTSVQPPAAWNLFDPDVLRWLLERKFAMSLLRQFSELRVAIEPAAAGLAARLRDPEAVAAIEASYRRMEAAEAGGGDPLDADIAFHVAVLNASGNPFYRQFHDVVTTALHTSIRFTNRFEGRTASLPAHRAVLDAIAAGDWEGAERAMRTIIADVMALFADAETRGG